ncbi:MAG: BNR-4 repeat-containing protein [Planctomycetes bacterium]|nr:BNR-4 repeat-containing protein [Planctomycetota bacterium]
MITTGSPHAFDSISGRSRSISMLLAIGLSTLLVEDVRAQGAEGLAFDGASTWAALTLDRGAFSRSRAWSLAIDVRSTGPYHPQTFLHAPGTFWLGRTSKGLELIDERSEEHHAIARVPNIRSGRLVLVFDDEGLRIHVQGEPDSDPHELAVPIPPPESLILGAREPWRDVLHGAISELAFWSRPLTPQDANAFLTGNSPLPSATQHYRGSVDAEMRWLDHGERERHATFTQDRLRPTEPMNGYRGTWYANQRLENEYRWKYSGGLGTYCAKHMPHAIYAKAVDRTFFVYGGARPGDTSLLHMVSYYDHATGRVPKPTFLLDKFTTDAHDNPVLSIDDEGYLWVFSSSHGTVRPSYISRSAEPYSVERFEHVLTTNFSYPQPWHLGERGFLFVHTRYENGRSLYQSRSRDGRTWTEGRRLVRMEDGHYGVSEHAGDGRVGLAFNLHPKGQGLNHRTNLYYLETRDGGETWTTVTGEALTLPVTSRDSETLVLDTVSRGELVYLKDLAYDEAGHPAVLIVTSRGFASGPENAPRTWRIVHWTGTQWTTRDVTTSDNNYDMGSLYRVDGRWNVIAPTGIGPQPYNPGGEVFLWRETEDGTFTGSPLTTASAYNHTYVRRPRPWHPGFQAFWADGHGRRRSDSRLFFLDGRSMQVRVLPDHMQEDWAIPQVFGQ